MKIIFALFMLMLISISICSAQVTATNSKSENFNSGITGLGFSGGTASGAGVSIRYHSTTKASFQIIGGVFRPQTSETFASIGFEYQHDLVRSNASRFFAAGASSYLFNGSGGSNNYAGPFRLGAGLGGEFSIQEGVHFTFEALFTYFSDGTILPLPQLAFHYYFY